MVSLLKSIRKKCEIENFYAFAWTVAHRVYADFCEKRRQNRDAFIANGYSEQVIQSKTDPIAEYIESEQDNNRLCAIKREIAFLSKIYRDVFIMYYLDERGVSDIANIMSISETAVKQRLFSARNSIKKEVEKMDIKDLTLKPIQIKFVGTGMPVGNDPREKAERIFSQNLVYLCKDTARSAKELSELLHVPMPFIEEELEIQCRGVNGHYGLLKKLDSGKYISNFIILDAQDYEVVNAMYKKNSETIALRLKQYLKNNESTILDFPFKSKQKDIGFVAWSLVSSMIWGYKKKVNEVLKQKYFSDLEMSKRDFYSFGFATKSGEEVDIGFYGCDGISGSNICGYSMVRISNIYGRRIKEHFHCGHNISLDAQLMMTLKAIEGLAIDSLSDEEKEIVAKAIGEGYLKKENNKLYPKILVMDTKDEKAFTKLSENFVEEVADLVGPTVDEMHKLVKKFVPKHLMNEYTLFVGQTCCGLLNEVIEKCIELGALNVSETSRCAEGTWMFVHK
jgi:RNA polymerase sigma factor (sigma-70 family)